MQTFVAPGGSSSSSSSGRASRGFVDPVEGQYTAPKPTKAPALLPAPKPAKQGGGFPSIKNVVKDVTHVAKTAAAGFDQGLTSSTPGRVLGSLASGPSDLAHIAAHQVAHLAAPTATDAQREALINNQIAAGKSPEYAKAIKASGGSHSIQGINQAQALAAKGAKAPEIQKVLAADAKAVDVQNKRLVGDIAQTGALAVGGPETGALVKGGEAVVKEAAPDIISKTASIIKSTVPVASAGAVGNAGSTISANPNASTADILKSAAQGYEGGTAIGLGTKTLGAAVRGFNGRTFGQAPVDRSTVEPTKIPVTDKSTGTVQGKVSNTLPAVKNLTAPEPSARPSDEGYTDFALRSHFNAPAKDVVRQTPEAIAAAADTRSNDPLTVTAHLLANTTDKSKVGGIVDTLIPKLPTTERTALVKSLQTTKDPNEVGHLLYDAVTNRANHEEAAAALQGTPLDKKIAFTAPGEAEVAQRAQLHQQVGSINKQLADHAAGTRTLPQETVDSLSARRQSAQDILEGKQPLPGKPVAPGVAPLPFTGEQPRGPKNPTPAIENGKSVVQSLPAVQEGDRTRQAQVNQKAAEAETSTRLNTGKEQELYSKLSPKAKQLGEKLESKTQMTPAQEDARLVRIAQANLSPAEAKTFIQLNRLVRADNEFKLQDARLNGENVGRLSNYFRRFYDRTDTKTDTKLTALEAQRARIIKNAAPGYTHPRLIDTRAEARGLGLKLRNSDVYQDHFDANQQYAFQNGSRALERGLNEAHPGQIIHGSGIATNGQKYDQLRIRGGSNLGATKEVANYLNQREQTELSRTPPEARSLGQKIRAGYKSKLNKPLKETVLAGGLFHGARTGISVAGQQALSLSRNIRHPLLQLGDNLHLIGSTFSSKVHDNWVKQLSSNGANHADGLSTVSRGRISNLNTGERAIAADLGKQHGINKVPFFKQAYSAVFDRQIPDAKTMIFEQRTAGLDSRVPGDLAKMRKVAEGINRGLGGIDNNISGLTPKLASAADNLILGRDLNEGIIETLGHTIKPNSTDGRIARQFVLGSAIVSTLPGMAVLAHQGAFDTNGEPDYDKIAKAFVAQFGSPQIPTPWHNAPTSTHPNGTPITLKLPTTFISLLTKAAAPLVNPNATYSGDRFSGIEDTATARLATPLALVEKLKTNKDFYGQPIFTGNKGQSAFNVVKQVLPIPAAAGATAATGGNLKQGAEKAALSEVGLRPSTSTLPSPELAHTHALNDFYNTKNALGVAKQKVTKQMNALIAQGNPNQAARLAHQFNTQTIPQTVQPFRTKYAVDYNPAWDDNNQGFLSYRIPISPTGFGSRYNAVKETQAINNWK